MIATEPYLESFAELESRRAGDPAPIRKLRREAIERFQARGWPTAKEEDWRNTNVSPIAAREFVPAPSGTAGELSAAAVDSAIASIGLGDGPRAVFVDGRLVSDLTVPAPGMTLSPMRDVVAKAPEKLAPALARLAASNDPFTMLNTAFLEEGVVLEVPKRCVSRQPIHLVFLSTGRGERLSSVVNVVFAGESSQFTLVESYLGNGSGPSLTNSITQIAVGENASVEHLKLQREGLGAFHIGTLSAEQARDSRFSSHLFSVGAALARNNVDVRLDAEGAECILNGLFLAAGRQHVDNFTVIDHARPHGTSRELYKGILDGASRGAFTGRVLVRPNAQKTDAQQTSKNLILSRDALVNSTPQLEIRANDVKCKHGATTGQLDADSIFYLRSRGISEEAARNLLTYAFAVELVQKVSQPALRKAVDRMLHDRLPDAPEFQELV
jgi:Fe-S cluster assembly protein SufD